MSTSRRLAQRWCGCSKTHTLNTRKPWCSMFVPAANTLSEHQLLPVTLLF
jgi:hypothetical protein